MFGLQDFVAGSDDFKESNVGSTSATFARAGVKFVEWSKATFLLAPAIMLRLLERLRRTCGRNEEVGA
jgi:hypothetical protein